MSHTRWLRTGWVTALLFVSFLAGASERRPAARLTGTFLQPGGQHELWTEDEWGRLFQYFRELRLSQLIIQWSLYEGTALYPTKSYEAPADPPLDTILRLADEAKMSVLVGLAHEEAFWKGVEGEPDLVEIYLQSLKRHSLIVAREAADIVREHSSFEGWYIPQEIDDETWLEPERREVLFHYLSDLNAGIRGVTAGGKLALSGFSSARADPQALGCFWAELVRSTGVDVVVFQDGIGAGKLDLRHLPLYLESIRRALEPEGRDLRVVVETFRQVTGPPIDDRPFKAVPATLERLSQQLEVAARFASGGLVAFAVPEYMTPLGGVKARRLFEDYRRRLGRSGANP